MTYSFSKAQPGKGTVVSIGPVAGTSSPTFVAIGEVKSSSISGTAWKTDDVTNFQSLAEEWITTILATGEVSLAGNRVSSDAGQLALAAAFATGELYMFTISLPKTLTQTTAGDSYALNALVLSQDFTITTEKAVEFSTKLKISGAIVLTVGS